MNNPPASIFNFDDVPYNESGQLNSQLEPVFHTFRDSKVYSEIDSDPILYSQPIEKFKLIFIGNSGVGKSSLIFRLTNKQFPQNIKPTNGYEVSLIEYRIRNRLYALSFWDSSGDEKYDQIVNAFYKDLSALILVFDLNNQKSFEDLEFWLNQAKEFITTACIPFLLGVKSDLEKTVDDGLIKELISSEKLEYFECSSLSGKGCDDLLGFLIGKIENNRVSKMYLTTEPRLTIGMMNSNQKKEFLYNSEMYFAKKNRNSLPEIKLQKVEQEHCILI